MARPVLSASVIHSSMEAVAAGQESEVLRERDWMMGIGRVEAGLVVRRFMRVDWVEGGGRGRWWCGGIGGVCLLKERVERSIFECFEGKGERRMEPTIADVRAFVTAFGVVFVLG